jgi:hypothetical protein
MCFELFALACLLSPRLQDENPNAWIWFDSRETATPPKLVLTRDDGTSEERMADADLMLLGYLPDAQYPWHPQLSVNLCDTNRVLLQFPVERGLAFASAEIVMSSHPFERLAPRKAFDVAIHAVDAAWKEDGTSWETQPAFAEDFVRARVEAVASTFRVDVTSLVKSWASGERENHGILIQAADPMESPPFDVPEPVEKTPSGPPEAAPATAVEAEMLAMYDWAGSIDEALERARDLGRPVLALVSGDFSGSAINEHERLLLATALSDPWTIELVAARFIPVRVRVNPGAVALALAGEENGSDPLLSLGTKLAAAKPPALVIATGAGEHVATLASIGSFDDRDIRGFLREALGSAPPPTEIAGNMRALLEGGWWKEAGLLASSLSDAKERLEAELAIADRESDTARLESIEQECDDPLLRERALAALRIANLRAGRTRGNEPLDRSNLLASFNGGDLRAGYWRAAEEERRGEVGAGAGGLRSIAEQDPESPWARKARIRLAFPDLVRMYEPVVHLGPFDVADESALRTHAVDFLLATQLPSGSWPIADVLVEEYRAGVASLCAQALLRCGGERAKAALARADAWLAEHVAHADPASLNSFGATYWLDYQLARRELGRGTAEELQAAVDLLLGGQMANGAWSYSKAWGESWTGGFAGWPATNRGRAHSMNTGIALEALGRAMDAGAKVGYEPLTRAVEALRAMRRDVAAYTYTWPDPDIYGTQDASIARAPACELALWRQDEVPDADLATSIERFLHWRGELDVGVKLTGSWLPPHAYSAYFYYFAYYHAARAILALEHASRASELALLRADVLAHVDSDGTWTDFTSVGKPYGTAMALLVLELTRP